MPAEALCCQKYKSEYFFFFYSDLYYCCHVSVYACRRGAVIRLFAPVYPARTLTISRTLTSNVGPMQSVSRCCSLTGLARLRARSTSTLCSIAIARRVQHCYCAPRATHAQRRLGSRRRLRCLLHSHRVVVALPSRFCSRSRCPSSVCQLLLSLPVSRLTHLTHLPFGAACSAPGCASERQSRERKSKEGGREEWT